MSPSEIARRALKASCTATGVPVDRVQAPGERARKGCLNRQAECVTTREVFSLLMRDRRVSTPTEERFFTGAHARRCRATRRVRHNEKVYTAWGLLPMREVYYRARDIFGTKEAA